MFLPPLARSQYSILVRVRLGFSLMHSMCPEVLQSAHLGGPCSMEAELQRYSMYPFMPSTLEVLVPWGRGRG